MQGKSILGMQKIYYGMFKEGAKSGRSDGFRRFEQEQVWKKSGVRDKKGWSPVSSWLVGTIVWPCPLCVWGSELNSWSKRGCESKHVMASEYQAQLASKQIAWEPEQDQECVRQWGPGESQPAARGT